jgi:hypothetical protein
MSIWQRDQKATLYADAWLIDARKVVDAEIQALSSAIAGSYLEDIIPWLKEEFHPWLMQMVTSTFYSTVFFYFRDLSWIIVDEIKEKIELPPRWSPERIRDEFLSAYLQRFGVRWADSSAGQILYLAENAPEQITERLDDWSETKAERVQKNELVRSASGLFTSLVFSTGLRVVWRIRGARTCKYCRTLEGKVIGGNDYFVQAGDQIQPGDLPPMRVRHRIQGSPLHRGCDCYQNIE